MAKIRSQSNCQAATSTTTTTDPATPDPSELIKKKIEKLQFSSRLDELRMRMDRSALK